jgi:AraC-like DNA-binding protein
VSDKRVNYASKLLGIQCLFIATTFALPLIVAGDPSRFSWSIGFLVFLPACYGALTYLYCRTAITGLPLQRIDLLHLSPLALCYLLNYDILVSSEKALGFVRLPDTTLFRHSLTKVIFYGQIAVYSILLVKIVSHYQGKARQTLSSFNPDVFKWLWSLISFMVLIWSLKVISYFFGLGPLVNILADCLLVLMVYFIAIVQWRNPNLFHIQQLTAQLNRASASTSNDPFHGLLDQDTRIGILKLVKEHVEQQALYRNSELTLATLADQVGVSVHHLSETLNQYDGKNFNLFINEYRVEEVCQRLDQKSERKLIDLAMDAGFSSKSSFNAIFKRLTGKTPSMYRRQAPEVNESS